MDPFRAIVITGPVGAGKSTASQALCDLMTETGKRVFVADMDYLRAVLPEPEGDAFGAELGYKNLAAMWPNAVEAGARFALIPDIVESADQRLRYEQAMPGVDVTVVRLDVPMAIVLGRLEQRQGSNRISWFRNRAPELQRIMERERIGDIVIPVSQQSPREVAQLIVEACGLA